VTEAALKNFLARLLDYYGQTYRPEQARDIVSYLMAEVADEEADELVDEAERIPRYGEPMPIIEHFEPALRIVREKMAKRKALSPYDPCRKLLPASAEGCLPREEVARRLKEARAEGKRGIGLIEGVIEYREEVAHA
jgi:hypothetical protein